MEYPADCRVTYDVVKHEAQQTEEATAALANSVAPFVERITAVDKQSCNGRKKS